MRQSIDRPVRRAGRRLGQRPGRPRRAAATLARAHVGTAARRARRAARVPLTEACTLVDRPRRPAARRRSSTDAVGGSGVANRILTGARPRSSAAVGRCEVLGIDPAALDVQSARLDAAVAGGVRDEIRATVDEVDAAVTRLERDLIKEASLRARRPRSGSPSTGSATPSCWPPPRRVVGAGRTLPRPDRRPPELAVPGRRSVLGPPPAAPAARRPPTPRAGLQPAAARRVRAPTRPVRTRARRSRACLRCPAGRARDDLRGLLGAYRTRAARTGHAEDPVLTVAYEAARDLLWSAPCDLAAGAPTGRGVPARGASRRRRGAVRREGEPS